MKIGIIFPQAALEADPIAVRDFVQAIEGVGYAHLLVYDHVLGADPTHRTGWFRYTHESLFHEPFALLSYIAGFTRRIELATGVLVLPQRQTALVAKQAAYTDRLSNGRLRLGVGIGWNEVEYQALGEDFHTRGARIEEQITVLRALWSHDVVTFRGRWHRIIEAGINPRPVNDTIPIWIGGAAEPVLRRVGRLADGWMPERRFIGPAYRDYPHESWASMLDRVRNYALQAGRDPGCLGIDARVDGSDLEALVQEAAEWRQLGATHLSVSISQLGAPIRSAAEHLEMALRVADAIGL